MNGTLSDSMENKYDALPYHIKEFAGLPSRFYNLPIELQDVFTAILEEKYKTKKELDIEEQLGYIEDITNEACTMVAAFRQKYIKD